MSQSPAHSPIRVDTTIRDHPEAKVSRSPRRRSRSPRRSPPRRSPPRRSPPRRSPPRRSPARRSSPRRSRSPPPRRPSPRRRSRSPPPRRSRSPRRRVASPVKRSRSPPRPSPSRDSRSPPRKRRRSESPTTNGKPETMEVKPGEAAYLLGRGGATKRRLANFSGAALEIDTHDNHSIIQISGTPQQIERARMCIDITLQQRDGHMDVDFASLEKRVDVTIFDVDQEAVGFVLGTRGATLRQLETRYKTFMFFDNNGKAGKKRLYIMGDEAARESALRECKNAVDYKMSGRGDRSSWRNRRSRSRSPERRPRGSPSRSPPRRRSRSPPRRY